MSLGWLTESSLIPKDPKPIKGVGESSFVNLQAAVQHRERQGPPATAKRRRLAQEAATNAGVDARRAKDERDQLEGDAALVVSSAKLREKARRYEELASGCAAAPKEDSLVDFAWKREQLEAGAVPFRPGADEVGEAVPSPSEDKQPPGNSIRERLAALRRAKKGQG